ncbi:hypothetical protein GPALN_011567 [Globodera pallida]|nr:hypothetical protein GPALN_011567 [Globodera pallida]
MSLALVLDVSIFSRFPYLLRKVEELTRLTVRGVPRKIVVDWRAIITGYRIACRIKMSLEDFGGATGRKMRNTLTFIKSCPFFDYIGFFKYFGVSGCANKRF